MWIYIHTTILRFSVCLIQMFCQTILQRDPTPFSLNWANVSLLLNRHVSFRHLSVIVFLQDAPTTLPPNFCVTCLSSSFAYLLHAIALFVNVPAPCFNLTDICYVTKCRYIYKCFQALSFRILIWSTSDTGTTTTTTTTTTQKTLLNRTIFYLLAVAPEHYVSIP